MSHMAKIAVVVLILCLFLGVFGSLLARHPYDMPSGASLESPSFTHILGTDDLGIDLWAQICHGARISITISLGVATLACVIGNSIGIVAGYKGGYIAYILMRLTDMMIVLPQLPTMIVLGAFFGPSTKNIILVLSFFSWSGIARITRSKILTIMQQDYIQLSRGYGGKFGYIYFKHIHSDILPLITLSFIKTTGKAIIAEASLSFLGLGDPTSKSWGLILNRAIDFNGIYFTPYWKWWVMAPLAFIMLLVISIYILGREVSQRYAS